MNDPDEPRERPKSYTTIILIRNKMVDPIFVGGVPGGMESPLVWAGIFVIQAAAFYFLGKSRAQSKTIAQLDSREEQ